MVDLLASSPLLCGFLLTGCIMYTLKNSRLRDTQGKFLGLMIVILTIGILIIASGYHGVFTSSFSGHPLTNGKTTTPLSGNHLDISSGISQSSASVMAQRGRTSSQRPEHIYGIMFDAGSTGSRIHVFKFRDVGDGKPFEFVDELFQKVTPGLSSYADNPKEAADSLRDMMEEAKKYIPQDQWTATLIALKATAGLRKLEREEADNILNEVRQLFIDYPFKHVNDSVAIMEGTDEGVFSWFTVNFYAGVIGDSNRMQGVMDLGGGSTQITFNPIDEETIKTAPQGFVTETNILNKKVKLYTHSYLDLGLMAGRLQIMGGKVGSDTDEQVPLPVLTSPCFPENYKGSIEFGQDEYTVHGAKPAVSSFDDCSATARKIVQSYKIHTSSEIQNKPFCAISYFYDRAVEAGLLAEEGGNVLVGDFSATAQKVCSNPDSAKPFLCLDLCYLSALLEDGYKMNPANKLSIQKKINGEEISWALGAMFDFIGSHGNS